MVDGLGVLLTMVGMTMLIRWLLQHDKAPDGKTRGFYALREPEQGAAAGRGRRGSPRPAAKPAPAAAAPLVPAARPAPRLPFQGG
jgi:hypothetical protein